MKLMMAENTHKLARCVAHTPAGLTRGLGTAPQYPPSLFRLPWLVLKPRSDHMHRAIYMSHTVRLQQQCQIMHVRMGKKMPCNMQPTQGATCSTRHQELVHAPRAHVKRQPQQAQGTRAQGASECKPHSAVKCNEHRIKINK